MHASLPDSLQDAASFIFWLTHVGDEVATTPPQYKTPTSLMEVETVRESTSSSTPAPTCRR